MSSRVCTFTERLPLELRRAIYELGLQSEQTAKITGKKSSANFNASLFHVSKSISQESREVFFETNTMNVRPVKLPDLINRYGSDVRRLHIEDDGADDSLLADKFLTAATILAKSASMTPKLKIVTFECQGLHITVRELVQRFVAIQRTHFGLNFDINNLQCTGIGSYTLRIPGSKQEWRFSYSLLADLWSTWNAKQTCFQPSFEDMEDYYSARGPIRVPAWMYTNGDMRSASMYYHNVSGLAAQITCYSGVEAALPSVKPQTSQLDVLRRFELIGAWEIKESLLRACVQFSGRLNLRDVREEHDPGVLEWATELLAPNTKDFAAEFGKSVKEAEEYVRGNQ